MNELAAGKAPAPPTTTSSPSPHTSLRTPLAEGTALVGGGARPPYGWTDKKSERSVEGHAERPDSPGYSPGDPIGADIKLGRSLFLSVSSRRWPEVLVVMPSLVESVKVAPRSGMVVLVLSNGNAISLNPDVVRRLARASSSSEPEPKLVPRTSGWARLMERLGL